MLAATPLNAAANGLQGPGTSAVQQQRLFPSRRSVVPLRVMARAEALERPKAQEKPKAPQPQTSPGAPAAKRKKKKKKRGPKQSSSASAAGTEGADGAGLPLLEAQLKQATTRQAIASILASHPSRLTPSELVLACNQLARVCEPSKMTVKAWGEIQAQTAELLVQLEPSLEVLSSYEQVVLLAALARVRFSPTKQWLERYFQLTQPNIPHFGPGYITILLRALTRLNLELRDLKAVPGMQEWMHALMTVAQNKVWSFRGDELVRMLGALGELHWQLSAETMAAFTAAIKSKLDYLDPPLLSRAMLAYTGLRNKPEAHFLRTMYTQVTSKLPMFDDEDLATAAQALMLVKRVSRGHEFFAEFLSEVMQKLPSFSPDALANLMDALAEMVEHRQLAPYNAAAHRLQQQQQQQMRAAAAAAASGQAGQGANAWVISSPGQDAPAASFGAGVGSSTSSTVAHSINNNGHGSSSRPEPGVDVEKQGSQRIAPHAMDGHHEDDLSASDSELASRLASNSHASSSGAGSSRSSRLLFPPPAPPLATLAAPVFTTQQQSGSLERPVRPSTSVAAESIAAARPSMLASAVSAPPSNRAGVSSGSGRGGDASSSSSLQRSNSSGRGQRGESGSGGSSSGGSGSSSSIPEGGSSPWPPPWAYIPLPPPSPAFLAAVVARARECLPMLNGTQLVLLIRGLSALGAPVDASFVRDCLKHMPWVKLTQLYTPRMVHLAVALAGFQYVPESEEARQQYHSWLREFARLAARRSYMPKMVCHMVHSIAHLPVLPQTRLLPILLQQSVQHSRMALKRVGPRRLMALGQGLRSLRHTPEFAFAHAYAQAVRFHWSSFEARDYPALLAIIASFKASTMAVDQQWLSEMMLMVLCKQDAMDGSSIAEAFSAVAALAQSETRRSVASLRWTEMMLTRVSELQHQLAPYHAARILGAVATLSKRHAEADRALVGTAGSSSTSGSSSTTTTAANGSDASSAPSYLEAFKDLLASLHRQVEAQALMLSPADAAEVASALPELHLPAIPALEPLAAQHAEDQKQRRAVEQKHQSAVLAARLRQARAAASASAGGAGGAGAGQGSQPAMQGVTNGSSSALQNPGQQQQHTVLYPPGVNGHPELPPALQHAGVALVDHQQQQLAIPLAHLATPQQQQQQQQQVDSSGLLAVPEQQGVELLPGGQEALQGEGVLQQRPQQQEDRGVGGRRRLFGNGGGAGGGGIMSDYAPTSKDMAAAGAGLPDVVVVAGNSGNPSKGAKVAGTLTSALA